MRRAVLTLLVTAAAALGLSGCAGAQKLNVLPRTPARSGVAMTALPPKAPASPQMLRLGRCELRFTGVSEAMGTGTEGTVSYFLELRFVNDGRACTVGSKSRLIMTARTDIARSRQGEVVE